jgi:hypothetical protein
MGLDEVAVVALEAVIVAVLLLFLPVSGSEARDFQREVGAVVAGDGPHIEDSTNVKLGFVNINMRRSRRFRIPVSQQCTINLE